MATMEKGMVILAAVTSPPGSPAQITYNGPGQGALHGKTLFDVVIEDMHYGFFVLPGTITTVEEACKRLLAPALQGAEETVAQLAVAYRYLHVDDNEYYGEG